MYHDQNDHQHDEDCQHLLGDLSNYLDSEVSAELCAEIEKHMDGCDNCQVVIDTLRKTIVLYRGMPQPDMPDGVSQRLYKALYLDLKSS